MSTRPRAATSPIPVTSPRLNGADPRILIVDSDDAYKQTLARVIHFKGYTADFAANGQEAAEKVQHSKKHQYSLIIIGGEGVQAIETTKALRTMESVKGTFRAHIIGNIDNPGSYYQDCLNAGMNVCRTTKLEEISEILILLGQHLPRSRS